VARTRHDGPYHLLVIEPHPVTLMGTSIDNLDVDEVVELVVGELRQGHGGCIVTPNVDNLRKISASPGLAGIVSRAELVVADGMPLVWASRLQGTPLKGRVNGTELVIAMAGALARAGLSMFLLGAEPGVGERAAAVLRQGAPGLDIAGTMSPGVGFESNPAELEAVVETLQRARPAFVVVALGCPKQEQLMDRLRRELPSAWFIGAGSALTIVSGTTRRAPAWMRRAGLEWLHRLRLEPRRLFRRYVLEDAPFALRLLSASLSTRFEQPKKGGSLARPAP
jgi:N-acetylglucosaminyldiphosphoundecaprenol N-acetyl-beta-D-mannosaminyltransferase